MSSNMLYLDEDRSQVFWYPELFYRYVNTDLADVEKVMRKNFQRLEEYELLKDCYRLDADKMSKAYQ